MIDAPLENQSGSAPKGNSFWKNKAKVPVLTFLIRWWAAGAVYFYIGWGTKLGQQENILSFVFTLGLIIGLFNSLLVNPVLKMLFNVSWHLPYSESNFVQRFILRIKDVGLALTSVILVTYLYEAINKAAISLFHLESNQVFLPGEPILFALFFTAISTLILWIAGMVKKIIHSRNK